ncbi:regulatory signaling modulator protein AmpE [Shewanella sp. Choline-02u-19]|jgi:AmpE protein|uniref:beta-lactamase regulator AmpE n=1 Tax=unclassified Shewanella TaxID=196818 RepID=UPI000C33CC3F|nr:MULTISPECIES: beta-lactamase regulator AmpE [unclassified Shewanella]PKG55716.1 regulatory signaling modulator protein AmpE [Shewanella sp. GutDb-MelDb]PKG72735.1 regulatory signaling modulator protein AmpE [Shewanella sp. GutCb]PKH57162.1 regulatory signaling modulator protein AmpE [Shewanella sp. Bg11-22]PKI29723.1 regulatory signaling modulator protein AmpE [Shewanella sp. Choline-02u-19]
MALFSLLIAIFVERMRLLPDALQFDVILSKYHQTLFGDKQVRSTFMMALALLLPALSINIISWFISGMFWGAISLVLWVAIAVLCFSHNQQRQAFKRYIQAACRGDSQACFNYAAELDSSTCLESVSEQDLGERVGQSVAWINYRYYGAIALYLILLGPVGSVLYCTVRFYSEENRNRDLELPLVDTLLFILDWLPSRIFAFGYVLSGHFRLAISSWISLAFNPKTAARDIITKVATKAETLPESSSAPVCVQSTIALLQLSKRNFILLITVLSLMTIFGVVS